MFLLEEETYTFEWEENFLYSKNSEYIHATNTGIIPSKNDTWDKQQKASLYTSANLHSDQKKIEDKENN